MFTFYFIATFYIPSLNCSLLGAIGLQAKCRFHATMLHTNIEKNYLAKVYIFKSLSYKTPDFDASMEVVLLPPQKFSS